MSNSSDRERAPGAPEEPPKLKVSSARDLFESLRADSIGVRLSVLAAISRAPKKALSYGPFEGRDLLTEMIGQLEKTGIRLLRRSILVALAVFDDARVLETMENSFHNSNDAQEATICARRLAAMPLEEVKKFFIPYLAPGAPVNQARCAASILGRLNGHPPAHSIRIAVLTDGPFDTPPVNESTEKYWLKELGGPWADKAQVLLETLGEPAYNYLAGCWSDLSVDIKIRMLDWGARARYERTISLCRQALDEGGPEEVDLAALKTAAALKAPTTLTEFRATELYYAGTRPDIKAAALRAGANVTDIRLELAKETETNIRLGLIARMTEVYGQEAIGDLVGLFEDKDWRVRSGAVNALISLGPSAAGAVKKLRTHANPAIRAAAEQVLTALSEP